MASTWRQQLAERQALGLDTFLHQKGFTSSPLDDGSTNWINPEGISFGDLNKPPSDSSDRFESQRSQYSDFVNDRFVGDRFYVEDPTTLTNTGFAYNEVGYRPEMLQKDENGDFYIPAEIQNRWSDLYRQRNPNGSMLDNILTMAPLLGGVFATGGLLSGAFGAGGVGEAASWTGGFDGMAGDSFANWLGDGLGGGAGGGFDPSAVMGDSNGFNGIDFDNFNPGGNSNPFGGNGGFDMSQWNTNQFPSSTGGLANSITPNFLSQAGGAPLAGMSGAAATGAGISGLGGSSFADMLGNILKTPQIPGMPGSTGANMATSLANYFMQNQRADALKEAATQSANLNNPMMQPQRLPFQAAYGNLMLNPNSYFQTPYAQGMTNQVNQAFQANVGKYGPSGTVFSDYLKNYQNVLGQDYFKLADQLGMAGGFNQGTGGAGTTFGTLAAQSANAQNAAYEGFGKLFSQNQGGNNNTSPFQITVNPTTGTSNYSG